MKNILKTTVMVLLLSISGIAKAQSGPKGHGFLKGIYQKVDLPDATVETVCRNAGVAMFSDDTAGIHKYFNKISGFSYFQMKEKMRTVLETKLTETVSDNRAVQIFNTLHYKAVDGSYWDNHLSGYILANQLGLHKWNPKKSTKYSREKWLIAYYVVNGKEVDLFVCHCLNPVFDKGHYIASSGPSSNDTGEDDSEDLADDTDESVNASNIAQSGSNNNQVIITGNNDVVNINPKPEVVHSVVMRDPVPYNDLDQNHAKKNTNCHTLRTVAYCALAAAAIVVAYELLKPKQKTVDTNHDNSWKQDSGGSPWPTGSGSNVPNGPTLVIPSFH